MHELSADHCDEERAAPLDRDPGSHDQGLPVHDPMLPPDSTDIVKTVGDLPFTVDLRTFLRAELRDVGHIEVVVHSTRKRLEIIIRTGNTGKVLGVKG
mmetsp:Transcript_62208/g.185309  ORF Transcript_62208/g.185309 Transcript_62208/m.185309 type:complete len:98 (+) Transcript_62208:401-694(+)